MTLKELRDECQKLIDEGQPPETEVTVYDDEGGEYIPITELRETRGRLLGHNRESSGFLSLT